MRSWLAAMVADEARSANSSNCSPMRFSASPRAQYSSSYKARGSAEAGVFERGDDKAGIGTVQRVLGLADNPPLPAPTVARAIAEVVEHPRRLARRGTEAPRFRNLLAEHCLKAGIACQTEHIIDAVRFAPPHQLVGGEAAVAAQDDAHPPPRSRICAMMRAISSIAPSLPATFARRCRASSRCRPQNT